MRLHARLRLRHTAIAAGLLLASLVGWALSERASCRAMLAKLEDVQRVHKRDDVHKILGLPSHAIAGADVLSKRYWGSDAAIGPNDGRVVLDERYAHDGLWCSYLIVIGYGPDGTVRSKFFYG